MTVTAGEPRRLGVPSSEAGTWQKSSYSDHSGECVEVAPDDASTAVRDSKDPSAGHLTIAATAWTALTSTLRA
ncbi:DUF397 domain-containing protein [Streptomyces sp. SID3343]|uniref:DUF397 domain-containing protein n=1 Tax=Streptomyces sp. SID3343 TaxID=2690260 RepID=UPI0031F8E330